MPQDGAESGDTSRQLRRSQALAAVAREVAGLDAPAQWADRAVAAVESAAGWRRVFLFRLDEQTGVLHLLASRGATEAQARESAFLEPGGPSVSVLALVTGQPVVSGQTEVPAAVAENAHRHGLVAYAVLPLVARGRVLGTLTLIDVEPRAVSLDELEFLQAIAHEIAAGLDNARLYEEARAREARAEFLTEISDLFGASLDPKVVLQTVVERCVGPLGDGCGVFLNPLDPQRDDRLTVAAVHHRRREAIPRIRAMLESLPFRFDRGIAGHVASSGKPLLIPDFAHPGLDLPAESWERVRLVEATSCIITPLRTSRGVLGILVSISTPEPDGAGGADVPAPLFGARAGKPLREGELDLALEVCHRAAAAIENAELYSQAESARLWLRTIFNQMADGVLVLDAQGRVLESNAAASRLIGGDVPVGATPGERVAQFDLRRTDGSPLPADEQPSALALATGEPVTNVQVQVVHADGNPVELSANASPLHDEAGRLMGAVTVLRDVTELRRLERAKDSFLSVASHELRTPLTPLKGLTQILLRQLERAGTDGTIDRERISRYLRTMDGQVDRLAGLVNDLLDVSRIRTGRMQLRPEAVDLVVLARAVLDRFAALAPVEILAPPQPAAAAAAVTGPAAPTSSEPMRSVESPGGVVERVVAAVGDPAEDRAPRQIRFQPRVPTLVGTWDPARLEQVVTNLIANSLKYSPAGGTIAVIVDQRVEDGSSVAHLQVRDPGIGLPPEQIADLFQPFARLANAPAESFGGLGLGLYISHDIVERHGGRIWAESPGAGKGSTFHVTLPL